MKTFKISGTEYTVEPCTAICSFDIEHDEDGEPIYSDARRQEALFVEAITEYGEEKWAAVVFDCWEMRYLNSDADFLEMWEDSSAWETDWEVLNTVKK